MVTSAVVPDGAQAVHEREGLSTLSCVLSKPRCTQLRKHLFKPFLEKVRPPWICMNMQMSTGPDYYGWLAGTPATFSMSTTFQSHLFFSSSSSEVPQETEDSQGTCVSLRDQAPATNNQHQCSFKAGGSNAPLCTTNEQTGQESNAFPLQVVFNNFSACMNSLCIPSAGSMLLGGQEASETAVWRPLGLTMDTEVH